MLSTHAQARSQQRAIPRPVIDLLLDYGVVEHRKNGLELLYFTNEGKHSARQLMKRNGVKHSDHCLNAYLLESSDGWVITVGHRTKRVNRN